MEASLTAGLDTGFAPDFYYRKAFVELEAEWTASVARFVQIHDGAGKLTAEFPVIIADDGQVKSVTSPYGYGGPPTSFFESETVQAFHRLACQEEWASVFLRCHPIYGRAPSDFESPFAAVVDTGELALKDLSSADDDRLLGSYSKGLRRDIRRARREPISVTVEPLGANLDAFSNLYDQAMQRLDARSSLRFSADYLRRFAMIMGPNAFAVHCTVDERLVAAGCFVVTAPIAQYHLSAADYAVPLAGYAMKLVIHQGLLECRQRGVNVVNLGGGLGRERDSLFDFKRRFSSDVISYQSFRMLGDLAVFQQMYRTEPTVALRLPHFPPQLA